MTMHTNGRTNDATRFGPGGGRAGRRPGWQRLGRPLALAACAAQAACASSPDSIDARYVSPNAYQNWSCAQLSEERLRLTSEVQRISGLQRENANADAAMMAVGVILFWPVLFGLAATKDRKDELGRLKGEHDAVDLSMRTRHCTVAPPATPAPAQQTASPSPSAPGAPQADGQANGLYRGKGRTDAWCQTPTLDLHLRDGRFEGELSEAAGGAATGTVSGTLDGAGVASLTFSSGNAEHFSGTVEGSLKDGLLDLAFATKTNRACSYIFGLRRAPL